MAFLPGKNLTVTINSNILTATTSNITDEIGEVDVTNLRDGGDYALITDVKKVSLNYEIVMDGASLLTFNNGTQYSASWAVSGGGHSFTGTLVPLSQDHKGGIRGAYTVSGKAVFTGAVVRA